MSTMLAVALMWMGAQQTTAAQTAEVKHCLVVLIRDVEVPAQEAGQILGLEVKEGANVEAGALLGQIDDEFAKHQTAAAKADREAAAAEAASGAKRQQAKAVLVRAQKDYDRGKSLDKRGASTETELNRLEAELAVARADVDQKNTESEIAKFVAARKSAEAAAAEVSLSRRQILAPFSGQVVELYHQIGEWVQPGEKVFRLIELDRLRVEGFVSAAQYDPADLALRPVEATVKLAGGREETFKGKITFVSPLVEADGQFRVWAEVVNRQSRGQWLLRPGLTAEMHIELPSATEK